VADKNNLLTFGGIALVGLYAVSQNEELKKKLAEVAGSFGGKLGDIAGGGGFVEKVQSQFQSVSERFETLQTSTPIFQSILGGGTPSGGSTATAPVSSDEGGTTSRGFIGTIQDQATAATGTIFGAAAGAGTLAVGALSAPTIIRGGSAALSQVPRLLSAGGSAGSAIASSGSRLAGGAATLIRANPIPLGIASGSLAVGATLAKIIPPSVTASIRGPELQRKIESIPVTASFGGVDFRAGAIRNIPIIGKLFGG